MKHQAAVILALLTMTVAVSPASADVKAGVDAWSQGDYAKAISEWRPLAQAGDADAQFNLAQAYKLGRGVPVDLPIAMEWYRKAAAQGHLRAEDNYGLLLFQQNRRQNAMPFLQRSAERGEARAQYLVGTALFNGDLLPRDWTRAYAMMARASGAGLPQATSALVHMDQYIPEGQRKDGLELAASMAQKMPAPDIALAAASPAAPQSPVRAAPKPPLATQAPPSTAHGTNPPAPSKSAPSAKPTSAPAPVSASATAKTPEQKAATPALGVWRVQLGAFSDEARAETLWKNLTAKVQGLSAHQHYLVKGGAMTRLQAGPLKSRVEADKLCGAIKSSSADCIVKAP